jgi:hypothetical protein
MLAMAGLFLMGMPSVITHCNEINDSYRATFSVIGFIPRKMPSFTAFFADNILRVRRIRPIISA